MKQRVAIWGIVSLLVVLLLFVGGKQYSDQRGSGTPRPNLTLISIDALRPDHLGCYGYDRPTSPFLDSLATVLQKAESNNTYLRQHIRGTQIDSISVPPDVRDLALTLYDGEFRYTDAELRRLFRRLEARRQAIQAHPTTERAAAKPGVHRQMMRRS